MRCLLVKTLLFILYLAPATAQEITVTVSGIIRANEDKAAIPYATISLRHGQDSTLNTGTVTGENGQFVIERVKPGSYRLTASYIGFKPLEQAVLAGTLNPFLDLGELLMKPDAQALEEVTVTGQRRSTVSATLEKKSFTLADNTSQQGGSVLSAMRNLPGITVGQDGTVQLRGSDKVTVLIDGRQTAITGFGNQNGLDNIPASAIERIEIINNPSARYDAQGNAGIINIIYKKASNTGFNGKAGFTAGMGSLWEKNPNLPGIRPQYLRTPKLNPSLSLNYRTEKANYFIQGDLLDQKILNKNDFSDRHYDDGNVVRQQYQENRNQTSFTIKTGTDFFFNARNEFTLSALYGREVHTDYGDLPFYNRELTDRSRLWIFREWEANSTLTAQAAYTHRFPSPGHRLAVNGSYSFQREDEKYWMTDNTPLFVNQDTFMLVADQHVVDFSTDYVRPLRSGRLEAGAKLRWRRIPTNMEFFPGDHSMMDTGADGWANYNELIPAMYGSYIYEGNQLEVEAGLRMEYVDVAYDVIPGHNTYRSDGYDYFQPFPNVRAAYVFSPSSRISLFYNRRVDRPEEQDLRIFPKYDDPEILKTGNPALRPQFTQTMELGYKTSWSHGSVYTAGYHRITNDILTRILTLPVGQRIINSVSQNAGKGTNTGVEILVEQALNDWLKIDLNLNGYHNAIDAFRITNAYPVQIDFASDRQTNYAGNVKANAHLKIRGGYSAQLTGTYLTRDRIPQGEIGSRGSVDLGIKRALQGGKGEIFMNGSDVFNTMRIKRIVQSDGFSVSSTDYYESQVFRVGYTYQF